MQFTIPARQPQPSSCCVMAVCVVGKRVAVCVPWKFRAHVPSFRYLALFCTGDSWTVARQYMQRRRALSGGRFLVRLCGGLRLIHGYLLYGLLPVLFARSLATWSLAGARASARSRLLLSRCSVPRPEGCAAAVERDHGGRRGAATRRGRPFLAHAASVHAARATGGVLARSGACRDTYTYSFSAVHPTLTADANTLAFEHAVAD